MLQVYLPIADVSINIATLLIISIVVGFFAGLLGIGGGFLITPILIFLGIPPIYAVANGANNILAASVSGTLAHWFKNQLDIKMGVLIIVGGVFGSVTGIILFQFFQAMGFVNNIISIMYCVLLSSIGISMLIESLIEIRRIQQNRFIRTRLHKHYWVHNLPFKTRIKKSKLYISIMPPIFFWHNSRNFISDVRCWWRVFTCANYDLYFGYASKTCSWNFFVCHDFYNDDCNLIACAQ